MFRWDSSFCLLPRPCRTKRQRPDAGYPGEQGESKAERPEGIRGESGERAGATGLDRGRGREQKAHIGDLMDQPHRSAAGRAFIEGSAPGQGEQLERNVFQQQVGGHDHDECCGRREQPLKPRLSPITVEGYPRARQHERGGRRQQGDGK